MEEEAPLPALQQLQESLQCSICKEFYDAPVTTPCGHTFCSACIRANLDYRSKGNQVQACPSCRKPVDSSALRKADACVSTAVKGYIEALPVVRSLLAEVAILKAQLDQHKQQSDDASCLRAARAAATRARTLLMRMHAKQLHGNNSGALQHGAPAAQSAAYETGPADREVCTDAHDDELQAWHEETCVNSTDQDATNAPSMSNDSSGQQQQQQQQLQQSQHLQQQQQSQRAKSRALRSLDGDDDDGAEPGHQAGSRQAVGDAEDSDYVPPQLGVPVKHKRGRPPKNVVVQAAMVSVAAGPVSAAKRARGEAPGHAVQNPPVQPQAAARPVPALDAQPQQGAVLAAGSGTCPVCDKSFRLTGLQAHVELCIARAEAVHNQARRTAPTHVDAGAGAVKKHAGASGTGHMHGPSARSGGGAAAAAAPWSMPPKLAFHMLSDKEARRRVMELSLPTAGLNKEDLASLYKGFMRHLQTALDRGSTASFESLRREFLRKNDEQQQAMRSAPRVQLGMDVPQNDFSSLITAARQRMRSARSQQQQQPEEAPGATTPVTGEAQAEQAPAPATVALGALPAAAGAHAAAAAPARNSPSRTEQPDEPVKHRSSPPHAATHLDVIVIDSEAENDGHVSAETAQQAVQQQQQLDMQVKGRQKTACSTDAPRVAGADTLLGMEYALGGQPTSDAVRQAAAGLLQPTSRPFTDSVSMGAEGSGRWQHQQQHQHASQDLLHLLKQPGSQGTDRAVLHYRAASIPSSESLADISNGLAAQTAQGACQGGLGAHSGAVASLSKGIGSSGCKQGEGAGDREGLACAVFNILDGVGPSVDDDDETLAADAGMVHARVVGSAGTEPSGMDAELQRPLHHAQQQQQQEQQHEEEEEGSDWQPQPSQLPLQAQWHA